jgi:uncharacterized protein (TIGR04255 family)
MLSFGLASDELFGERVSRRGSKVPKKLKSDAIVEALLEIRFDTATSPEFLFVRLAEFEPWKNFSQSRLPAYGIPETIRQVDPNFRYQPTFELSEPKGQRAVRIGPKVLSYHLRSPYNGWSEFGKELSSAIEALFTKADELVIRRLGLRYLNALTSQSHAIRSIRDLDVSVCIGNEIISDGLNINMTHSLTKDSSCTVRVATPQFITGSLPPATTVLADIDVFTPEPYEVKSKLEVVKWVDAAHASEKVEFFVLLTDETIASLEDKQ